MSKTVCLKTSGTTTVSPRPEAPSNGVVVLTWAPRGSGKVGVESAQEETISNSQRIPNMIYSYIYIIYIYIYTCVCVCVFIYISAKCWTMVERSYYYHSNIHSHRLQPSIHGASRSPAIIFQIARTSEKMMTFWAEKLVEWHQDVPRALTAGVCLTEVIKGT